MKEIKRRAMSTKSEGIACGPTSMYSIDAEIVVEDNGHQIFLHTQWVDEVSDMILFEATTESLYDCYEELNTLSGDAEDVFDKTLEKRDLIQENADVKSVFGDIDIYERYAEQYVSLLEMMQGVLEKDGIDFNIFQIDEYEDEEDE